MATQGGHHALVWLDEAPRRGGVDGLLQQRLAAAAEHRRSKERYHPCTPSLCRHREHSATHPSGEAPAGRMRVNTAQESQRAGERGGATVRLAARRGGGERTAVDERLARGGKAGQDPLVVPPHDARDDERDDGLRQHTHHYSRVALGQRGWLQARSCRPFSSPRRVHLVGVPGRERKHRGAEREGWEGGGEMRAVGTMAGRYLATRAAVRPPCDSTIMRPACSRNRRK